MNTPSSITQRSEAGHAKKIKLESSSHLTALDGFRGLLAMWVYLGHLANEVGSLVSQRSEQILLNRIIR